MRKVLKIVYKKYLDIKNECLWHSEYKKLIKQTGHNENIKELIIKGKNMILIPHSDDEWIGCSQVINKMKKETLIFCNMDMLGGDTTDLHKIRYKELKKTVDKYNAVLYTITNNKIEKLKKIIKEEQPDSIFVPFFLDWHPEHIETINILFDVMKSIKYECNIISYQVSLPIIREMINAYIPMKKKDFQRKWEYFRKVYKTQTKIPYRRFMYNERINGSIVKQYACEPFVVCTKKQWLKLYEKIRLNEIESQDIVCSLNSISKTRKKLDNVYLKLNINSKQ